MTWPCEIVVVLLLNYCDDIYDYGCLNKRLKRIDYISLHQKNILIIFH
jgi:hypothetical protein